MFTKSFNDMMNVDVTEYVKQRDDKSDVDYLPWAACKKLLHDNGAEVVMFWPVPGPDGSTLRKSDIEFSDGSKTNRCYEVLVHIQIDNLEWDTFYPVLNGNNPVKDNSMSQLRVHNAVRRAFVKGVAERTGLGFNLWLKDDDLPVEKEEDLSQHKLSKCKERLEKLITYKINDEGIPLNIIADRLGMDADTLRAKLSLYKELALIEKRIWEMKA
jgi:hypothetical protein